MQSHQHMHVRRARNGVPVMSVDVHVCVHLCIGCVDALAMPRGSETHPCIATLRVLMCTRKAALAKPKDI
jgi:uncharacterized membrane protein (DUF441 family)